MGRRLFGRNRKRQDMPAALNWLEADDGRNPFGMRVLDCRPLVDTMTSTTSDPAVAQHFVTRDRSGAVYRGTQPDDAGSIPCHLTYPTESPLAEGALFLAAEMEDKWDIFHLERKLVFVRSWTGQVVAVADVQQGAAAFTIDQIAANTANGNITPEFVVRQIDFLIKSHILNLTVPHPIPAGVEHDPERIALAAFSYYGRRGTFASYGDTTQVRVQPGPGDDD